MSKPTGRPPGRPKGKSSDLGVPHCIKIKKDVWEQWQEAAKERSVTVTALIHIAMSNECGSRVPVMSAPRGSLADNKTCAKFGHTRTKASNKTGWECSRCGKEMQD